MRSILRQTSWLVLAQASTRIIGFFYTIFLARNLGVLDFGIFSVGLAYFSIISSLADFGFNRFLTREIAKEKLRSWELIWNVLMLRLTVLSVFFAGFAVTLYIFDTDKMRVSTILLASLAVFPQTIAITFDAVFIALKKLQFSAVITFISSISTAVLGIYFVSQGFKIFGAVNALIFGQAILAILSIIFLSKNFGIKLSTVSVKVLKEAIFGSLPYGILAILGLLYFRVDTVILSYMKGNFETGIYAAGYKFLEGLIFIPIALNFALFPNFVELHLRNPLKIRSLLSVNVKMMFLSGTVATLFFFFVLPEIIKMFLPNYLAAIDVIRVLSLAIPFIFVHVPASSVLTSSDKYLKPVILFSLIPLSFNVILNLILIPKFGFMAAAWITVASDILSAVLLLFFINKLIPRND